MKKPCRAKAASGGGEAEARLGRARPGRRAGGGRAKWRAGGGGPGQVTVTVTLK